MIATLTLLTDFGLVVLIWIVQLIIYPAFYVVADNNFAAWHKKYMSLISYLVIPFYADCVKALPFPACTWL